MRKKSSEYVNRYNNLDISKYKYLRENISTQIQQKSCYKYFSEKVCLDSNEKDKPRNYLKNLALLFQ